MHSKNWLFPILISVIALTTTCSSSPPAIRGMVLDPRPSETVPLAAQVTFETDRPTSVSLEFDDGERNWRVDTGTRSATNHVVPILGMRPDRTHQVVVVVTDENGLSASSEPLEITTDPLPDDFPPIDLRISQPERMEPGVTLFGAEYRPGGVVDENYGLLVAVDEAGEVVWYYKTDYFANFEARRLANGNILYMSSWSGLLYEINMLGNVVSQWHSTSAPEDRVGTESIAIDTDTFHHDAFETSSGNILTISTELRTYPEYPSSTDDPDAPRSTSDVIGDVLVEFTRQGQVVREVKLLDVLDPYRVGFGSLGPGPLSRFYRAEANNPMRDWAHTNAVVVDQTGRYAIASPRHLDAVIKVDLETSELVWILGNHGDWGPEWQDYLLTPTHDDLMWQFHQHAPMITPDGTILMFDNGNDRARPFQERMSPAESFSRAVEYSVDEENMEVTEVWSYGGPGDEQFFAGFVGDADWMPQTGNVLIDYGGLVSDPEGNPVGRPGPPGHNWIRIVEVTHDAPAEKVFEFFVDAERPRGFVAYKAERLPSLYP